MVEHLKEICLRLTSVIEKLPESSEGRCYVFGHVLSEGLKKAGLTTKETTGHLLIRDKFGKLAIYGSKKYKGKNIGDFHCWCELEYEGEKIIIDPSLKHNKKYLKNNGIKPHEKIPDVYIDIISKSWLLTYEEDESLAYITKECIEDTDSLFLEILINGVSEDFKELLKSDS